MNDPREHFWRFSVETYSKHTVAPACLALQREYGVDVNMLLYCCWFGLMHGALSDTQITAANEFSMMWAEHAVLPLRSIRQWLKNSGCNDSRVETERCMALRERIKGAELEAERVQQRALALLTEPTQPAASTVEQQVEAIVCNLRRYLNIRRVLIDERVRDRLLPIILGSVTGVGISTVAAHLKESGEDNP